MKWVTKVLRIGILINLLSLAAVITIAYYFERTVDLNPVIEDCRLVGLSYEIVVDLYGQPEVEGERIFTWEDGQNRLYWWLYPNFPLMQPGDSVIVKRMAWKYRNGLRRNVHLYRHNGCWWVFSNSEWSDSIEFRPL